MSQLTISIYLSELQNQPIGNLFAFYFGIYIAVGVVQSLVQTEMDTEKKIKDPIFITVTMVYLVYFWTTLLQEYPNSAFNLLIGASPTTIETIVGGLLLLITLLFLFRIVFFSSSTVVNLPEFSITILIYKIVYMRRVKKIQQQEYEILKNVFDNHKGKGNNENSLINALQKKILEIDNNLPRAISERDGRLTAENSKQRKNIERVNKSELLWFCQIISYLVVIDFLANFVSFYLAATGAMVCTIWIFQRTLHVFSGADAYYHKELEVARLEMRRAIFSNAHHRILNDPNRRPI